MGLVKQKNVVGIHVFVPLSDLPFKSLGQYKQIWRVNTNRVYNVLLQLGKSVLRVNDSQRHFLLIGWNYSVGTTMYVTTISVIDGKVVPDQTGDFVAKQVTPFVVSTPSYIPLFAELRQRIPALVLPSLRCT